jgi:hypothetical protein
MPVSPSFEITFASNQARTEGYLTFTDTTNWAGAGIDPANVEASYEVVAPDGRTYRLIAFPQDGNIFPDIDVEGTFPLPQDINGLVQTGDYVISAVYNVSGPVDSGSYDVGPVTANLCTDFPDYCLDGYVSCLIAVVTLTDNTPWASNGWTVDSRAMTLQYPSSTQHADITGAGPSISTAGFSIYNGNWMGTSTVTVTKGNYTATITAYKAFTVNCDMDGCDILCMLKSKQATVDTYQSRSDSRYQSALQDLRDMEMYAGLVSRAIACGDDQMIAAWLAKFRLLGTGSPTGTCTCATETCGEPRPIVPLSTVGSGTMWTPDEGTFITITAGVNSYTFSVSAALVAIINALYNTDVDSPDGSVTVTETVAGILKTKHLAVTKVMPDYMEFLWTITDTTGPVIALGTPTVVGTTFKIPGTITPSGNLYIFSNLMLGSAVAFNVDAEIVDPILRSPYSTTHRDHPLIRAEVISNTSTTQFTLGIVADDPVFMTDEGKSHLVEWFDRHLASFKVLFKLTKRTV